MRVLRVAIALLCVLAFGASARAQTTDSRRLEAGVTAATACLTASSYCGRGQEAMFGLYGSYWLTPRVEIGGRIARLTEPDSSGATHYYVGPLNEEVVIPESGRDRSRLYALGHIYRHFGPDPRVRFYAGIALGRQYDRVTVTCDAPDCQARLDRVGLIMRTGRLSHGRSNLAMGVGLSGHTGSFGWRAGVNLHNFPGENVGANEFFAGGAVRF